MMKKLLCLFTFIFISIYLTFGQKNTIDLIFTSIKNTSYIQTDSIKIINRTSGGDTILYWPDTILSINYVGIYENTIEDNSFQVLQNYPNPMTDQTVVSLYTPEKDIVGITICDLMGQKVFHTEKVMEQGMHSYKFTAGNGRLFIFTACWQGKCSSIKILKDKSYSSGKSTLNYIGSTLYTPNMKSVNNSSYFTYILGDELLYIGFADTLQSGIVDAPTESTNYIFQFATNITCPGTPTVEYEGQVYNTIQIFSQCWLKENLNIGVIVDGALQQTDNGTVEKYCYNNELDSCSKYGGLYQWHEMMDYTNQQGTQGICPPGWHLPTDEEWKILEGAVDSQYDIGDPHWDDFGWRGINAGNNLKSNNGWNNNGNGTDLFGFLGLPGGGRIDYSTLFFDIGISGLWWTSTESESNSAWSRYLVDYGPEVIRDGTANYSSKDYGFSVRCLKDN